jgi:endogenous inhibitor of DNA gyrase (YacG/DUF329 family)
VIEPKVRRDGTCYVCKSPRPFNPQKGVPYEAYTADPFCSATCARVHFGTTLTYTKTTKYHDSYTTS